MKNLILAVVLLFSPLLASAQLGQFGGGGNSGGTGLPSGCTSPGAGQLTCTGAGIFGSLSTGGTGVDTYTAVADPAASLGEFWLSSTLTGRWKYSDASAIHTIVGADSTDTLTNKTYDTAGTGNTFKAAGTSITGAQGNGAKLQLSTGSVTTNVVAKFDANGNTVNSLHTDNGTTDAYTGTGGEVAPKFTTDGTACVGCGGGIDGTEGTAPPAAASHDVLWADSTAHRYKMSNNNGTATQVVASGVDVNTSDQVTATHLAAALPVNQGGTATTSTLTGVVRGGNPMTAAELSGDCATSGSNAVVCTQVNGANFTVNSSGLPTKVDGITTAGQGVDIVQCITSAKVETGADASVLSCTPASAVGGYEVCVSMDVSAANTATLGWTATWTNTKTNANAPTNMSLFQMGVAAPALTFTAAANNSYYSCVPIGVSAAGTAIVVKTTFSGTSIAYNVSAWVKRAI